MPYLRTEALVGQVLLAHQTVVERQLDEPCALLVLGQVADAELAVQRAQMDLDGVDSEPDEHINVRISAPAGVQITDNDLSIYLRNDD